MGVCRSVGGWYEYGAVIQTMSKNSASLRINKGSGYKCICYLRNGWFVLVGESTEQVRITDHCEFLCVFAIFGSSRRTLCIRHVRIDTILCQVGHVQRPNEHVIGCASRTLQNTTLLCTEDEFSDTQIARHSYGRITLNGFSPLCIIF